MSDLHTPTGRESYDPAQSGQAGSDQVSAQKGWWTGLLDGGHAWGDSHVSPTRHGVTHYRLVVFPPGINTTERRLLRAWRAWPTWGTATWAAAHVVLASLMPPGPALMTSATAYVGGGLVLFTRTGEMRGGVRTLTAVRIAGHTDLHAITRLTQWKALTTQLRLADARRDQGRLSPAEHELAWWQVYDRLDRLHTNVDSS